jgi:putative membrane protein
MDARSRWARRTVNAEEAKKIHAAVREAEKSCGAEFVPVIVRRSSAVGHIGLTIGLILLLGRYFFRFAVPQGADAAWLPWFYPLAEAVIAGALGWFFSTFSFVQRLFVPRLDRHQGVDRRSRLEFYKHHVESSVSGHAVLLFLSLMERQAVVLCGPAIAKKIPAKDWQGIVKVMTAGASNGRLAEGMAEAIAKSAELVRKHVPKKRRGKGALPDRLIVKE